MSALDYINGFAPTVTSTSASDSGLPLWEQQDAQAIMGQANQIAGRGYQQYGGEEVAGFNPDQENAFQDIRDNQGSWQPAMSDAYSNASGISSAAQQGTGQAGQYAQGALGSVQGPSQSWNQSTANQYMSPYTSGVVDAIAQQGNQNLQNNILPGINSTFTGSGQFGSARNALALGQGIAQAQNDISNQQAQALENGYSTAGNLFNQDANRAQQQQQLQANTGLSAAGLANNSATINSGALDTEAQRMGALGGLQQQYQNQDAASLGAVGGEEQQLQQLGDTTAYNDFQNQNNYDWNQLSNMTSLLHGLPLNQTATSSTQNSSTSGSLSPLTWLQSLYGTSQTSGG